METNDAVEALVADLFDVWRSVYQRYRPSLEVKGRPLEQGLRPGEVTRNARDFIGGADLSPVAVLRGVAGSGRQRRT